MWLCRTFLLSVVLLISFANNAQSTAIESFGVNEFKSTLAGDTETEGQNRPEHRGSGR